MYQPVNVRFVHGKLHFKCGFGARKFAWIMGFELKLNPDELASEQSQAVKSGMNS